MSDRLRATQDEIRRLTREREDLIRSYEFKVALLRARRVEVEKERDEAKATGFQMAMAAGGELLAQRDEARARADAAERALREREGEKQGLVSAKSRSSARMEAVKFFASVIKSGEPWTKACDDAYAKALAEVSPRAGREAAGTGGET